MYNALCAILLVLCSPIIFLASFKRKYRILKNSNSRISHSTNSLLARFFLYKNPPLKYANFHFHACSLGEVSSIENIVKTLLKEGYSVRITTATATGYEKALKICENSSFLPFECFLPFWLKKCDTLVVFEAELWLNLFKYAKKQGARTILLNARVSKRSFGRYKAFGAYYKALFSYVDLVLAQSKGDDERLEILGAKNIKILGNIKSINEPKITHNFTKNFTHIIVLASSHEDEESGALEFFKLRQNEQLIIAPRHPQRFDFVFALASKYAKEHNLSISKLSEDENLKAQIVLIDKIGELINIYAIADVVVLCGSFFDKIGGHNPFEPAFFGCGIISGAFYHNQRALYPCVEGIKIAQNFAQIESFAHEKFSSKITNKCDFNEIISILKG